MATDSKLDMASAGKGVRMRKSTRSITASKKKQQEMDKKREREQRKGDRQKEADGEGNEDEMDGKRDEALGPDKEGNEGPGKGGGGSGNQNAVGAAPDIPPSHPDQAAELDSPGTLGGTGGASEEEAEHQGTGEDPTVPTDGPDTLKADGGSASGPDDGTLGDEPDHGTGANRSKEIGEGKDKREGEGGDDERENPGAKDAGGTASGAGGPRPCTTTPLPAKDGSETGNVDLSELTDLLNKADLNADEKAPEMATLWKVIDQLVGRMERLEGEYEVLKGENEMMKLAISQDQEQKKRRTEQEAARPKNKGDKEEEDENEPTGGDWHIEKTEGEGKYDGKESQLVMQEEYMAELKRKAILIKKDEETARTLQLEYDQDKEGGGKQGSEEKTQNAWTKVPGKGKRRRGKKYSCLREMDADLDMEGATDKGKDARQEKGAGSTGDKKGRKQHSTQSTPNQKGSRRGALTRATLPHLKQNVVVHYLKQSSEEETEADIIKGLVDHFDAEKDWFTQARRVGRPGVQDRLVVVKMASMEAKGKFKQRVVNMRHRTGNGSVFITEDKGPVGSRAPRKSAAKNGSGEVAVAMLTAMMEQVLAAVQRSK